MAEMRGRRWAKRPRKALVFSGGVAVSGEQVKTGCGEAAALDLQHDAMGVGVILGEVI
jgi:hypothetical protein